MLFRASFAWYEDIFNQARRGVIDSEFWSRHRTNLASLLQLPGVRDWWSGEQGFFGEQFRNEVNRELADPTITEVNDGHGGARWPRST